MNVWMSGVVRYLAALIVCSLVAATSGEAKVKAATKLRAGAKTSAVRIQARFIDSAGYRLLPNSTTKCAETLRGTLVCRD